MNNIAVIGAGQIGSRHLQALTNLDIQKFQIFVIDPAATSLEVAQQKVNEVTSGAINIYYSVELSSLPLTIDVAIIATNSMVRYETINMLYANRKIRYLILEKFLFPKLSDYDNAEKLLEQTNTYVNCPRRMWEVYKYIKQVLTGPLYFSAIGNHWGLGSNGIHMLDLFSYLTGETKIQLTSDFDKQIEKSKRSGYIEFTGTITGKVHTKDGPHLFNIKSFNELSSPITIFIASKTVRLLVKETPSLINLSISTASNNWIWEDKQFNMQFQSQLTNVAVNDLIENQICDLTPYEVSSKLHKNMLNLFLQFQSLTSNHDSTVCPIT